MSGDPTSGREWASARLRVADARDRDALADYLARAFPERTRDYWLIGLVRMIHILGQGEHLGHVLEADDGIVGVLLTLYRPDRREGEALCNLSSWHVDPDYRHLGMMLDRAATRDKAVTYLNISPEAHTRPLIKAMGYASLNEDTLIVLPFLSRPVPGVRIDVYDPLKHDGPLGDRARLARDHAAMGCRVLCAKEADGRLSLFVFQDKPLPGLRKGAAHLIHTEDMQALVRLAGPLGRALAAQGRFVWKIDGAAMPKGLFGVAFKGRSARWAKGAHPPGPNDFAYSELVIFGP